MNDDNAITAYVSRPIQVTAARWDGSEEGAENIRKFARARSADSYLEPADFPRVADDGTWHAGRWPWITVVQSTQQTHHVHAGQWLVCRERPHTREFTVLDDDEFRARFVLPEERQ